MIVQHSVKLHKFYMNVLTVVLVLTLGSLSCTAWALDLTAYEYKKKGNNRIVVYKHSGVNAKDRLTVTRDLKRIQKFLSTKPATPTYVHLFHSKKSNLLKIGRTVCKNKADTYSSCPSNWAKYREARDASVDYRGLSYGDKATANCILILGDWWWSRKSPDPHPERLSIVAHEYFHCHQEGLAHYFDSEKRYGWMINAYPDAEKTVGTFGPNWLAEGGATYFGTNYAAKYSVGWNYKDQMRNKLDRARAAVKKGAKLQKYISQNQSNKRGDNFDYDGGAWAMAYLANHKGGNKQVFTSYYKDIAELERKWRKKGRKNYGWQASFKKHFGMTVNQFYTKFHKFMKQPISKQMAILMSPGKK